MLYDDALTGCVVLVWPLLQGRGDRHARGSAGGPRTSHGRRTVFLNDHETHLPAPSGAYRASTLGCPAGGLDAATTNQPGGRGAQVGQPPALEDKGGSTYAIPLLPPQAAPWRRQSATRSRGWVQANPPSPTARVAPCFPHFSRLKSQEQYRRTGGLLQIITSPRTQE